MAGITDSSKFNGLSNYFVAADPQGGVPQVVNGNLTVTGSTTTGTISGSTGGTLPVNNGLTVTGNADISGDLTSTNYSTTGAGAVNFGSFSCPFITQTGAVNLNGGMTVNSGTTAMQSDACSSLNVLNTATLSGVASFNKFNLVPQFGMGSSSSLAIINVTPSSPVAITMSGNKCFFNIQASGNTPAVCSVVIQRDPSLPNAIPKILDFSQLSASGIWTPLQLENPSTGSVTLTLSGVGGGIGTPASASYRAICVWF